MGTGVSSTALYERFKAPERLVLLLEAMARGDEAEIERLRRTCPRKTYSQLDADFQDRYEMALDVTVVACGDLRAIVTQMRLLHEVQRWVRETCSAQQITATLAFLDGVRQGRGLPQTEFFRRGLRHRLRRAKASRQDGARQQAPEDLEHESDEQGQPEGFSSEGQAFYRRMHAVERRAQRWSRQLTWQLRRTEVELAGEMKVIWNAYDAFCCNRLGMAGQRLLEAFEYPARQEIAQMLHRHQDASFDEAAMTQYRDGLCELWDRRIEGRQ